MIRRLFNKRLVKPVDLTPSLEDFKIVGTFNPGAIRHDGMTYILIRVAEMPTTKKDGQFASPRMENGNIIIDWYKNEDLVIFDARGAIHKKTRSGIPGTISHLRLAKSRDGINIDSIAETPTIFPEGPYEELGVEDARITPIDDKFYITYVAVSRHGITTALASTKDFVKFEKHGIIFTTENKDVVLFPERVGNSYVAFHRPLSANPFGHPEMWMAYSPDLIHWGHHCVLGGCSGENSITSKERNPGKRRSTDWDSLKIGAGTPPIKTEEGWLEIYHGSEKAHDEDTVGVYCAGAALFDLDEPHKLIAKAKEPILIPDLEYERQGFLSSIVFPTGIVAQGDDLLIYYGAADTYTAVTKLSLRDVLATVKEGLTTCV